MRYVTKFCIATLVFGMLLAFIVFTLFANEILVLPADSSFFILLIAITSLLLAALIIGALGSDYGKLKSTFSCCGSLAVLGGVGLLLTAFLTSLSPVFSGIFFSIGIALCFFFLTLLLGGIFCLLHCYYAHGQRRYRNACAALPPRLSFRSDYEEEEDDLRKERFRRHEL